MFSPGFTAKPPFPRSFTASANPSRESFTALAEKGPIRMSPPEAREGFTACTGLRGLPRRSPSKSPPNVQGFTAPTSHSSPEIHSSERQWPSRESFTALAGRSLISDARGFTASSPLRRSNGFTARPTSTPFDRGFTAAGGRKTVLALCGKNSEAYASPILTTQALTGGGYFVMHGYRKSGPYSGGHGEQLLDAHNRTRYGCSNPHQLPSGLQCIKTDTQDNTNRTSTEVHAGTLQ